MKIRVERRWVGSKIGIVTDDVTFNDVLKPSSKGAKHGKDGSFEKR